MADYAEDLAALLHEIGEQRPVVLVALSMGGYVAFEFYRRYPERVRALVLVDTRAKGDSREGATQRYQTAERVRQEGSRVVADSMVEKLFSSQARRELRDHWHAIMAGTAPESLAAALCAMAERPDSTETLAFINRPTLIVVGAEDQITPPSEAEAMQEAIAGSDLEIIEGAGHMTPVEQPGRFVAILEQFLDDLEPLDQQGWPHQPDPDDM